MKLSLQLITILAGLICCTPKPGEKPSISELANVLDSSRVAHELFSPEQVKEIERIHTAFSEVSSRSLSETLDHFRLVQNPDKEIAVWLKMAHVYERFTLNKHIEEYDKKYEAYQLILLRSSMTEGDATEKIDIIYLTKGEVGEILNYYDEAAQPLKGENE